jgi:hypothetical protein
LAPGNWQLETRRYRPPIFASAARISSGAESPYFPVSSAERTAFTASAVV